MDNKTVVVPFIKVTLIEQQEAEGGKHKAIKIKNNINNIVCILSFLFFPKTYSYSSKAYFFVFENFELLSEVFTLLNNFWKIEIQRITKSGQYEQL